MSSFGPPPPAARPPRMRPPANGGPERFVVEVDRKAVDRAFIRTVVQVAVFLLVVLAIFGAGAATADNVLGLLASLVPLLVVATLLSFYCWAWGATRAIEWPLQVSRTGMVFYTPGGRIEFGWDAVTEVSFTRVRSTQLLTVRLHRRPGQKLPG